jgi:hypothetical protein
MANRRISSEQLLEMLNDVINTILMGDEAHFHLSGYVNKQNYHYNIHIIFHGLLVP